LCVCLLLIELFFLFFGFLCVCVLAAH
jgi:hypothetical protein